MKSSQSRSRRFSAKLAGCLRALLPGVGLLMCVGCLFLVLAPGEWPSLEIPQKFTESPAALPTIVLDPGHGGKDDGAQGNGLREKEMSLDVALRLEKILVNSSFPVILTRRDDTFIPLSERAAIANQTEQVLFVSIHFNHAPERLSTGVETFYTNIKSPPESIWSWIGFFRKSPEISGDLGEGLAGEIQSSLIMSTNAADRGIKNRDLYVVRHTRCPAVLVEGGFLNNPQEARLIGNGEYRQRLARAIAEGITHYVQHRPQNPVAQSKLVQNSTEYGTQLARPKNSLRP